MVKIKQTIPVFFAVDDEYVPFLAVAIQSLIENSSNENNIDDLKLGAKVHHPKFGLGTVVALKGPDVTIAFDNQGIKTINKEYTTLDLV